MVDEYKKSVQAERKKTAYMAVGVAIVIHVLFILSEWIALAFGVAGVGVLLYALYAETTGRRMAMSVAFVLSVGGTASGEHGIGLGSRKYVQQEHGAALELMKGIKQLFDPQNILNPGKIW